MATTKPKFKSATAKQGPNGKPSKARTIGKTKAAPSARPKTSKKVQPSRQLDHTPATTGISSRFQTWSDNLKGFTDPLANISIALTKASLKKSAQGTSLLKAADILRQAREKLGMTAHEVGQAINLRSPELLEQAETGKATLPVEVMLRLAAVLGRKDPASFFLKLIRSHNQELWKMMEAIGVDRLLEHAGREREFVNIFRRCDAARKLTDQEFAVVLAFIAAAFDMAMAFRSGDGAA